MIQFFIRLLGSKYVTVQRILLENMETPLDIGIVQGIDEGEGKRSNNELHKRSMRAGE